MRAKDRFERKSMKKGHLSLKKAVIAYQLMLVLVGCNRGNNSRMACNIICSQYVS